MAFADKLYEQVKTYIDVLEVWCVNCIDLYTPTPDMLRLQAVYRA